MGAPRSIPEGAASRKPDDPRPNRRAAVEADLLRATEELLAEGNCYTELSVEQIASRAGISRTAFYFYFNDKRQVLMRLVEGVAEYFYVLADSWWTGSEPDDRDRLHEALSEVLRIYREHAPVLVASVEASGYDPQIATFWRELMGSFIDVTREHIEAEQRAGRGGSLEPEAAAWVVVWMTERAWYQHMTHPTISDEAMIDALTTALWCTARGAPAES